jgi:23S rRNA pseudouridine955/2504/2580 synthase
MQKSVFLSRGEDGQRLDRWLQNRFPTIPYALIQKALRMGDIRVDGKKADGKTRLSVGQEIRLPPALRYGDQSGADRKLSSAEITLVKHMVLYEDEHLLVLNKPSGLGTQGGTKTFQHIDRLLMAFAKDEDDKPKLVHRLDKETSGVLLVAKNRAMAATLGNMFKHREISKTYVALTVDVPRTREDTINLPLFRTPERVMVDREQGKPAITHYRVLSFADREVAFVALRPETGRMHQLRAHLAHIHSPILGDTKYGGLVDHGRLAVASASRLWLHALALHFTHPVTHKSMSIYAPLPTELRQYLEEWNMEVPTLSDTEHPIDPMEERV